MTAGELCGRGVQFRWLDGYRGGFEPPTKLLERLYVVYFFKWETFSFDWDSSATYCHSWVSVLITSYVGNLMQSTYPSLFVYMAPCQRGQRLLYLSAWNPQSLKWPISCHISADYYPLFDWLLQYTLFSVELTFILKLLHWRHLNWLIIVGVYVEMVDSIYFSGDMFY